MSCHLLSLIEIYLLSSTDKQLHRFKLFLFRIHLFFLHAPIMAIIFPETNHRNLPGHVETFWAEYFLLLLVPIVLIQHYRYLFLPIYFIVLYMFLLKTKRVILLSFVFLVFQSKPFKNY